MLRLNHRCNFFILALGVAVLSSCYSYRPIRIAKKILLEKKFSETGYGITTKKLIQKNHKIYITKYFALIKNATPLAVINNKAVELAQAGIYKDAEILLQDILSENSNEPAAYNNLAIIYELFNDFQAASSHYLKATSIAPENNYFKKNFLSFEETKYADEHNHGFSGK